MLIDHTGCGHGGDCTPPSSRMWLLRILFTAHAIILIFTIAVPVRAGSGSADVKYCVQSGGTTLVIYGYSQCVYLWTWPEDANTMGRDRPGKYYRKWSGRTGKADRWRGRNE